MSKLIGYCLIIGILLISASPPYDPTNFMKVAASESSRNGLPSVKQGETNIDTFSVHPRNRWNESNSGSYEETLANSEFNWKAFDNDSATMERYRMASTLDGDVNVRWRLDYTEQGASGTGSDFEVPIMGLNVTTNEGSGNSSLNAYPWNSTHYILRPTFTTRDGDAWNSWNFESDYQDFAQMNGTWGADGWDFVEVFTDGWDDSSGGVTTEHDLGYVNISRNAVDASWGGKVSNVEVDTGTFNQLELKVRGTGASQTNLRFFFNPDGGGAVFLTLVAGAIPAAWTTYTLNLTDSGDWAGASLATGVGLHAATTSTGIFHVDYVKITTTNDSSDLTFFEMNEYYRAELQTNLRLSELKYKINDDANEKIVDENIGSFSINDYFDRDELVPDVFLGDVGKTHFLFAARSAGANCSVWWDYYEAEFMEQQWTLTTVTGPPDSTSAMGLYHNETGGASIVTAYWNLTVPELDSVSGKFSIEEIAYTGESKGTIELYILSVNASDGALNFEAFLQLDSSNAAGDQAYNASCFALPGGFIGTNTPQIRLIADDNRVGYGAMTFQVHFDKLNRQLDMQIEASNGTKITRGTVIQQVYGTSNEFVLWLRYTAQTNIGGANQRISLTVSEFTLMYRDLFTIPIDLPSVDDVASGISGIFEILLLPLKAILQVLGSVPGLLENIFSTITSVEGILGIIDTVLDTISSVLSSILSAVDGLEGLLTTIDSVLDAMKTAIDGLAAAIIDGLDDLLQDIINGVADVADAIWALIEPTLTAIFDKILLIAEDILTNIISQALAMMTAVYNGLLNFLRSQSFAGVTVGELLDIIATWMNLWWTVAGDIIGFATNFLSLWAQVFLMGLLGIILIWAAASANGDGAVFAERFTYAMTRNINPVSFIININIPLGLILLGNLFWVILAGYDWQALLDPAFIPIVPLAHFTLGAYEIPDYSDELDVFFEFTTSILDEFFDVFLDILFFDLWDIFVDLLDSDILGVSPALIIFLICGGVAFSILTRGRF